MVSQVHVNVRVYPKDGKGLCAPGQSATLITITWLRPGLHVRAEQGGNMVTPASTTAPFPPCLTWTDDFDVSFNTTKTMNVSGIL